MKIMCVTIESVPMMKEFEGVSFDIEVLKNSERVWVERGLAEKDEAYKQLIPYCLVVSENKMLRYMRAGSETRLHCSLSLGVGGHIEEEENPFRTLKRELQEELGLINPNVGMLGCVNSCAGEVSRVHLGVLYICTLPAPVIDPSEEIVSPVWCSTKDLLASKLEDYETWSQQVILNLMEIFMHNIL